MIILKIKNYEDIRNVEKYFNQDFIVDFKECNNNIRKRVIDFLAGFVYLERGLKKINKDQIVVKGV